LGGLSMEIITLSKYFKYNTLFSIIGLLIIVIFIYFWIAPYGLQGVAWASTIGMSVYAFMKSFFVLKKFKIQPYTTTTLKIFTIALIALSVGYLFNISDYPIINLLCKGTVYTLLFGLLSIRLKVSEDINQLFFKLLPFLNKNK
jgi:O-antigen/teichoic acid export membrane protein